MSICPAFRVRLWECPGCAEEPEQQPEEPEREERAALPPWPEPGLVRPVRPAQALT